MELKEKIRQIVGPNEPVYESIFVFDETHGCECNYILTLAYAVTGKDFTLTENFPGLVRENAGNYNPGFVKGLREKYFNKIYDLTVAQLDIDSKKLYFHWADVQPPSGNSSFSFPLLPDKMEISLFSSIADYLKDQIPEDWLISVGLNKGNSALFKFRSDFQSIRYYLTPLDKSLKIFEEFRKEYMEKHADKVFTVRETNKLSYFRGKD